MRFLLLGLSGSANNSPVTSSSSLIISVGDHGAIADGGSHPLSEKFSTLSAAQAVYPFATSLSQELDYCACKAASNAAFGSDGSENAGNYRFNKKLWIPAGQYHFGNDTWTIRNLVGGSIEGAGNLTTTLTGNNTVLAFDGLWYSELRNFAISAKTSSAVAALDIDGNVPGHAYSTRGVQAINLYNILVDGGNSSYAFALCRQGAGGAQGSECNYYDLHLTNALTACYYQNGFNAIDNNFFGGDCQNYGKYGLYAIGDNFHVFGMSFECTRGYVQVANDGWDIRVGDAGVGNTACIYGCRTESMRFASSGGSTQLDIRGCSANSALPGWSANHAYAANIDAIDVSTGTFYCTTSGTSGSTQPTWPVSGTISDGTAAWTFLDYNIVQNLYGSGFVDFYSNRGLSQNGPPAGSGRLTYGRVTSDYKTTWGKYQVIGADATSNNIVITVVNFDNVGVISGGSDYYIMKTDTSAHTVTVKNIGGGTIATLPGGSTGHMHVIWGDGPGGVRQWMILGQ